jgi:hypothetical protein
MLGRRAIPKGVARRALPTLAIYSRLLAIAYLLVKSITNWVRETLCIDSRCDRQLLANPIILGWHCKFTVFVPRNFFRLAEAI